MLFQPLIYGLIFVGVIAIVEGVYLIVYGKTLKREKKVNRRLTLLQDGKDTEEVLTILRAEREGSERVRKLPVIGVLLDQARQASISMTPVSMTVALVGLIGLSFFLLSVFTGAVLQVKIVVALMLGYGSLYLWLRDKARKRIKLFEEQLPDALDLMVRSLRVGHPMTASVGIVAREMPDPLGTEFGLVADEATYGMDINKALERTADRMPVADLRFLAIAMNIQSTSGGNLAEVLEGLSKVIRARFKLFRKVRAITAEARWSGWFLSIFPILALLMVQVVQPTYYDDVSDHALFLPGAILTFILLVVNVIFMRILVNIKV
ncbi:type II secretion system F family protein [Paralimibaculum aggregatum]|uniref:Type II secretion system F family protein n=1 Tax=Paralimibaculum aggregatum TaxID=3036245 RepID=A0ABQ6LI26_9RHOB|nr:type II secretion system F family protein [Limibaculum sp. NKW23]GMG82939.1 type II secretion system F family protein [Limibaculum sp. NKW23]